MSWQDKIENYEFSIKTGDNKTFYPLLKIGGKSKEFNVAIFDFIDVEGSFVDRRKAKSGKYDLVFYFQGDKHLETAEEFETSTNDTRYWILEHPSFGVIKGQPTNIERNESNLGITEFAVEFYETIEGGFLSKTESVWDKNKSLQDSLFDKNAQAFASNTELKAIDQKNLKSLINKIDSRIKKVLSDEFYNDYQSKLSEALNYADELILKPVDTISRLNRLIDIPNDLKQSLDFRGKLMNHIWEDIKGVFGKVFSVNNKSFIESVGAAVVSSLALASLSPLSGDYVTSKNTLLFASKISNLYEDYLDFIDNLQKNDFDQTNPYILDFETQFLLNSIVTSCLYNLYSVAFDAKQERSIYLEHDSNLILLTHKYLGLDEEDKNLETFRKINGIKNNKLMKIKKGTKITYFV